MRLQLTGFLGILALVATLTGCGGSTASSGSGGGGNTTITVNFTGAAPIAVAYQTGTGAFTSATLQGSALTFQLPTGTTDFSFAYVCTEGVLNGTYNTEDVIYANVNDGTTFSGGCIANGALQLGSLSGAVDASAFGNANSLEIHGYYSADDFDYFINTVPIAQAQSFNIPLIKGSNDVLITPLDSTGAIIAAKELTNQTVPGTLNGGNTVTFSTADQTTKATVAYQNTPAGSTPSTSLYFNADSGAQYVLGQISTSYPVMPSSLMTGNAANEVVSTAVTSQGSIVNYFAFSNSGGPITINYPNPWTCPSTSPAVFPVFDLSTYTGFTGNSGKLFSASMMWSPALNINDAIYLVAYPDAIQASALTSPDLSTLSSAFPVPASGDSVNWSDKIMQYSSGIVKSTPPNSSVSEVGCGGTFTAP